MHYRKIKILNYLKKQIFKAVDEVHRRVQGAYSVIIMLLGHGLIAFRDPYGIRPLIYGTKGDKKIHGCIRKRRT